MAIDGGLMDGWLALHGCTTQSDPTRAVIPYGCLTYYTPAQVPNITRLATTYALSDQTFSENDSPSWGGHVYAAAATLDGFSGENPTAEAGVTPGPGWGCDSKKTSLWTSATGASSRQPSCIPDPSSSLANGGAFRPTPVQYVPTIFDRLDAAGQPWKIYGQPTGNNIWAICPSFAECLYGPQHSKLVNSAQVLTDASNGTLPSYSIVTPSGSATSANGGMGTSQHNLASMVGGDNWIGKVTDAAMSGPEANSTAVFITYDDCGCFYDHVAPGVNPDGTPRGMRMPMVIVSPYARKGYTDSNVATFASILAFTEHTLGITTPLTANDAQAYDYSDSFDFTQVPLAPTRMVSTAIPPSTRAALLANPDVGDGDAT